MELVSLGYRTDLALLRRGGASVEDRGDYLVIRSPHNPTHWWGNFIVLADAPPTSAAQAWLDRFAEQFPDADYVAIGYDGTSLNADALAWFTNHGFTVAADMVMTATAVHPPSRVNTDAVHRPLDSDDDWAQSIDLSMLCKDSDLDPASHRVFVTAKAKTNRALVAAGHGQWFGSFLKGHLVAQLGLIVTEPGIVRFQSVETAPNHRRRGLAGTLVYRASGTDSEDSAPIPLSWSPIPNTSPSTSTGLLDSPQPRLSSGLSAVPPPAWFDRDLIPNTNSVMSSLSTAIRRWGGVQQNTTEP